MATHPKLTIATEILDILPNPVLIKNQSLQYIWVNAAFEDLFSVKREEVIGRLDTELFPERQVSQCNGGDLRVLENGDIDEAVETVFERSGRARETITRKSRLEVSDTEIYLVGVMHDITDVTRANQALQLSEAKLQEQALQLSVLATTDMLTNCANRRALKEYAVNALENKFSSMALLIMDIDKFKSINDQYGHDVGDATLQHFANEVRSQLSQSDKFYRYGGEEFVLLLDVSNANDAVEIAELIGQHIANSPVELTDQTINYTVSTGLVMKNKGESVGLEQLLQRADKSLYKAKESGRNRVELAA